MCIINYTIPLCIYVYMHINIKNHWLVSVPKKISEIYTNTPQLNKLNINPQTYNK